MITFVFFYVNHCTGSLTLKEFGALVDSLPRWILDFHLKFLLDTDNRISKCNFRVKNIFPRVSSRGVKVGKSKKFKCFKVPLVGTLNLCLEMPDSMKKVCTQSNKCELRKISKIIEN